MSPSRLTWIAGCGSLLGLTQTAAAAAAAPSTSSANILQLVNPFIGTSSGGHVFAGATLPFGMAKAVADVNTENQGGFSVPDAYYPSGPIQGFSHMHDSGTGGVS